MDNNNMNFVIQDAELQYLFEGIDGMYFSWEYNLDIYMICWRKKLVYISREINSYLRMI